MSLIADGASAIASLLGRTSIPGQYVIANHLGRLLSHTGIPVVGKIGPYRVDLDLYDEQQRLIYFGLYDRPMTRLLTTMLQRGSIFFDVGANVGYLTLLASNLVGNDGAVHAFEPIPSNATAIKRHISGNAIRNVTVNELAVADESGTLSLFTSEAPTNSGWASLVPSERRKTEITVPTMTLDAYVLTICNGQLPTLVKLDIEGAEPRALAGMQAMLGAECAPDIVTEINSFLLERQNLSYSVNY